MIINISKTSKEMAYEAAVFTAEKLNKVIAEKGEARLLLSTGESQIETLEALVTMKVEWGKVTMFHLDEYIALPESHIASFRKYLKERFINIVHPANAYLVDGEGDVKEMIAEMTKKLNEAPIDVALVGIGENAHIAFNDPPADFETEEAYKVVDLDQRCKQQQVNEGWFAGLDDVPNQAISMTVSQIMKCNSIISVVPGDRKKDAIYAALTSKEVTNLIPATILKTHPDWSLFIDAGSASKAIPQV